MASTHSLKADAPLARIATPHVHFGKEDEWTMAASHMALVHNMMIRGYNSIYLQAPKLKANDVSDFCHYCLAWFETVKGHHDSEEAVLFPGFEEATGVKGIMDEDISEHHAFSDGLARFKSAIDGALADPARFSGAELVEILDSFGFALHSHLDHEPGKIVSLSKYKFNGKDLFDKTTKHSMERCSTTDVLPFLWYNLDKEFEDGRWAQFPEMPAVIKWPMINVLGWWRSNWWRFGSSGADGVQRELHCLDGSY